GRRLADHLRRRARLPADRQRAHRPPGGARRSALAARPRPRVQQPPDLRVIDLGRFDPMSTLVTLAVCLLLQSAPQTAAARSAAMPAGDDYAIGTKDVI